MGLLFASTADTLPNLYVIPTKLYANWENGEWNSGLPALPDLNFQYEGKDEVDTTNADENHFIQTTTKFARNGKYSLMIFGKPASPKSTRRSEIGFMKVPYQYKPGEAYYYGVSYLPDSNYSVSNKFDTLITQWKCFSMGPNQSIKIVNDGTRQIYLKDNAKKTNYALGELPLNQWTDMIYFFKWSLNSDGITKIWKNGKLILDLTGPTLIKDGEGYMQMGMYTCINEPRTMYLDEVRIGISLGTNL